MATEKYPTEMAERVRRAVAKREDSNPFYLIDLSELVIRYNAFKKALPSVRPFYAIKCNTNPMFLHLLFRLGCGFDCASSDEMDRVTKVGAKPQDVIFANPCKLADQIKHARELGITRMTFDNVEELEKVAKYYPGAEMVLRIATNDAASACQFSVKFGARPDAVEPILAAGQRLGVKIIGVSYHVGSGCPDPAAHAAAATDALHVFEMGRKYGYEMNFLDIGGGFLGEEHPQTTVKDVGEHLNPVLAKFPAGTLVIAEPGRYFACHSHTLVTQVHSRRVVKDQATGKINNVLLYINERVYHSFNSIFFDHYHPCPLTLFAPDSEEAKKREVVKTTIFGPTCDSIDVILKDHDMPLLEIGEYLFFTDMGAYTVAAMTHFNGFEGAVNFIYTDGDKVLEGDLVSQLDDIIRAHSA